MIADMPRPAKSDAAVDNLKTLVAEAANATKDEQRSNLRERTALAFISTGLAFAAGAMYARPLTVRGNQFLVLGALGVTVFCTYQALSIKRPPPVVVRDADAVQPAAPTSNAGVK